MAKIITIDPSTAAVIANCLKAGLEKRFGSIDDDEIVLEAIAEFRTFADTEQTLALIFSRH